MWTVITGMRLLTVPVGKISEEAARLCAVTEQCLYEGISQAVSGNRLSDISHAIQDYVEKRGYSVVREFVGHGIGQHLHESPQIPNYGPPGKGVRLKPGMVLAIEPMINCRRTRRRDTGRSMDGGDAGQEAFGSFRAHYSDNRKWS